MIDACDPDADLDTLRKLIRMNTGKAIKLTKEEYVEYMTIFRVVSCLYHLLS